MFEEDVETSNCVSSRMLDRMEQQIHKLSMILADGEYCSTASEDDLGRYYFYPMRASTLIQAFEYLKKHSLINENSTFVDLGSGIGVACGLAFYYFYYVYGFEIRERYIRLARKIIPAGRFVRQDIMTVDVSKFDVVYYYCPFATAEKEEKFEAYVEKNMKEGAILMAGLKRAEPERDAFRFLTKVGSGGSVIEIYVKQADGGE